MPPGILSSLRHIRPAVIGRRSVSFVPLFGMAMAFHVEGRATENIVVQSSNGADSPSIELRLSGSTDPGAIMSYVPGTGSNAMVFQVPAPLDRWQWQALDGAGQDHLSMELRADHSLALINSAGIPKIVLTPGTDVVSPVITIGDSPVLTEAVADTRYLTSVLVLCP